MKQRIIILIYIVISILTCQWCNENDSIDPRDTFCGSYRCEVFYENHLEPGHPLYKPDSIYYTTLVVSKYDTSSPSILQISGEICVKINLDFTNLTFKGADFEGQRLGGKFFSDSIYLTTYMTPAALISLTYEGKKNN